MLIFKVYDKILIMKQTISKSSLVIDRFVRGHISFTDAHAYCVKHV